MSKINASEDDNQDSESQVDFANFTIFNDHNGNEELSNDTQETVDANFDSLKLSQKPNLSVLGLDSSLITNIMKRMKGKDSKQQVDRELTEETGKKPGEDANSIIDESLVTQKIHENAKLSVSQLTPTLTLGSTEKIAESVTNTETQAIKKTGTLPQTEQVITQTLALEAEPSSTKNVSQINFNVDPTLKLDSDNEIPQSGTTILKTQVTTQRVLAASSLKNEPTTQIIPRTQALNQNTGLGVDATIPIESNGEKLDGGEDDDDDDDDIITAHRRKAALTQIDDGANSTNVEDKTYETLGVPLEKYKHMTREEKINLRIAEKKKERDAKEKEKERHRAEENAKEAENSNEHSKAIDIKSVELSSKKSKRKTNPQMEKLADAVKQNALIRSSGLIIRKSNKSKFTSSKLLAAFESSSDEEEKDEKVFSETNKQTPDSSPKLADQNVTVKQEDTDKLYFVGTTEGNKSDVHIPLGSYREHILEESGQGKMVDLDSDGEDDDDGGGDIDEEPSVIDKKKLFDVKRMFSQKLKRKREHKKTIKDLLRQETLKQMAKLNKERQKRMTPGQKQDATNEKEIMEMMQQEVERNKRLAKIEQEKERRAKMILEGKLPIEEEMDESEIEDEEEEGDEEEDDDISAKERQEEQAGSDSDEGDEKDALNGSASEISFQIPDASAIKTNAASSMLADLFDQSTASNKSFEGVQGVDILKKLQGADSNTTAQNSTLISKDNDEFKDNSMASEWMDNSAVSNATFTDIKDSKEDFSKIETGLESQVVQEKKKILDSQNFLPETQVDDDDLATQPVAKEEEDLPIQPLAEDADVGDDDGDEDVRVHARKRVLKAVQKDTKEHAEEEESNDDDDEIVYEDEETRQRRVELIKAARRRAIERENEQRKAFKEAGMGEMMENEAVESDDEWQGIGGADGEDPDAENSEDEKILDDASKIVVDEDKIRADLAKHDIEADDQMVKKIYTDLKTGAFRKRRAHDGAYELDLSDDEDEYMRQFYEHRRQEYLEKQYMKDANLRKLAKSESSRAFYDTIASDSMRTASVRFEDSVDEVESAIDNPFEDGVKEKEADGKNDGIRKRPLDSLHSGDGEDEDEDVLIRPKKRRKLTVNQVRSMISFLEEDEDRGEGVISDFSGDEQDSMDDDDDGAAEIRYIKKHMKVKIPRKLVGPSEESKKASKRNASNSKVISLDDEGGSTQPIDDNEDGLDLEESGIGLLAARTHSLASSFRKGKKKKARYSTTTGHEVHEVHVVVGSKPAAHSTGSVSSLTARRSFAMESLQLKNGKAAKIARSLKSVRHTETMMKIYKSMSSFDDGWQ